MNCSSVTKSCFKWARRKNFPLKNCQMQTEFFCLCSFESEFPTRLLSSRFEELEKTLPKKRKSNVVSHLSSRMLMEIDEKTDSWENAKNIKFRIFSIFHRIDDEFATKLVLKYGRNRRRLQIRNEMQRKLHTFRLFTALRMKMERAYAQSVRARGAPISFTS